MTACLVLGLVFMLASVLVVRSARRAVEIGAMADRRHRHARSSDMVGRLLADDPERLLTHAEREALMRAFDRDRGASPWRRA